MKEKDIEEESHNSFSKDVIEKYRKSTTEKISKNTENKNKNLNQNQISSIRKETTASFDKILLRKIKKEEKELKEQMQLRQRQKLLKKLDNSTTKDYIFFFFLLISSSFNYNYLFLPFIVIAMIYLMCIENLNWRQMKIKYYLEIFTIGYASYLLLFKIIIFFLIKNEDESVLVDKKDLYIDLGCCILKNLDSYLYLILNFSTEVVTIGISGYSILTSFRCRLLKPSDMNVKTITHLKLSKYILIIYCLIVTFTVFNLSYLSIFYIFCIQFILLLSSVKLSENKIKRILKRIIYILIFTIYCQIILINFLNVPSVQKGFEKEYEKKKNNYFTWKKIGININSSKEVNDILIKFSGYFFSIITLIILINTINKLNAELNKQSDNSDNENNNNNLLVKKRYGAFTKVINNIMKFLYHPVFNFEASRVLSILWTYFYRNIFSLGILVFIFISFFTPHTKRNKCLVIFILTPMLILSLFAAHISNIRGFFEDLEEKKWKEYSKYGFVKYDNTYFEYLIGHIFFIIVMFLINSVYTAELNSKDIEEKVNNKKPKKIEMQILNKINRLEESILPKEQVQPKIKENNYSINDYDNESSSLSFSYSEDNDNRFNNTKRYIVDENSSKDINAEQKKKNIKFDGSFTFFSLMTKGILMHIDKITLIVMYFVSIYTVNLMHVILVSILIFQIISPGKLNYCYKVNALIFQLLYLIEFIIDLLKIKFSDFFDKHKTLLQFLIVYSENSNDIEIFIYGVIYCFYFQYRTCNIESIKSLLNNRKITMTEYIKIKLENHPKVKEYLFIIANIFMHIYLWFLFIAFIFFNSYFEINFLFGIKLFVFLICSYQFIFSIQSLLNDYSSLKCLQISHRIFLFLCCLNTLAVYLYQFLCKDFLSIKESINKKRKENNFFIKNLPNFGFSIYQEQNLYYNFLPHFITTFIAVLYIWRTEETLNVMIKNSFQKKTTFSQISKLKLKKKQAEKERMQKIKEEENEFIQDKLYSDKYAENFNEIKTKSKMLLKINIILFITQCYWLMLFFVVGLIFSFYNLSISMLNYVCIFGFFTIRMFHRIISRLRNYIKNKSYYISKVIRYSIVEKPKNREINKKYRKNIFRYLLFLSFFYILLIYFYGIFGLYQHGCNPDLFIGCEESNSEIFESDTNNDTEHNNPEAIIKSFAYLLGIYFDVRKENIWTVSRVYLVLTFLIILDVYNQKLESHYSTLLDTLQNEIQDLVNENNVLQKYADIADLNILIKIGLSIAGISLSTKSKKSSKNLDKFQKSEGTRSIQKMEDIISKKSISSISEESDDHKSSINISNEDLNGSISSIEKLDDSEEDDEPLSEDEPKENPSENYDLNEKDPSNFFLKNNYIQKFIDMIKKSNENEQQLSVSNIKERIIRFIKKLLEEMIIFISICLALNKLSIWTFMHFFVTFFLIFTKKTMFKFYLLYCFIFEGIIIQSIFFLLNINSQTSSRNEDNNIFEVLNKTMNIPLYKAMNMDEKQGFFFGMGVSKFQTNFILLDFIQLIILYFYLNFFSYSIYQDLINLGESSLSEQKIDFQSLNMEQASIEQIKTMTEVEFLQYKECLSCYDFNIGENLKDFFKLLKIDNSIHINPFETEHKTKLNLKNIQNPVLKELIEFRMLTKEYRDNIEKKAKKRYKDPPKFLSTIQKILYLYFHCFILILIIMISMMTTGFLSAIYFGVSFYYLMKSDCLYLGQEYTYPKAIKRTLRILVLIDITIQSIYQLPFFSMKNEDSRFKYFRAIGLVKAIEIFNDEINTIQNLEIFAKAFIYFLMSVQSFIYNSKNFKRYYLAYLLDNKYKTNKKSLINSFTFNNNRVKIYEKSLSIRQKNMEAMEDLKKIIIELNEKLNQMGKHLLTKNNNDDIKEKQIDNSQNIQYNLNNNSYINNNIGYNNMNNNNINQNNGSLQIIDTSKNDNNNNSENIKLNQYNSILESIQKSNKPKKELEEDEVKDRIRSLICDRFITKIFLWLHKHSVNYKNIAKDAKDDFEIETIKGETKIKSIIETDINQALSIIDLSGLDKNDMKQIETLIESNFDEKKKKYIEEKKFREKKSQTSIDKFKKFGNNLLKLNRFAKLVLSTNQNLEKTNGNMINNGGIDILELFRIQNEKEREEKAKKEKEMELKREKIGYIEELFETKLFKKYLTTSYQLKHIIIYIQTCIINNFTWLCYFFMILDHMLSGSVLSLVYPLSIFCYALLEYPRPKKYYWIAVLCYTMVILFIKFIIHLRVIFLFITEDKYEKLIQNLYNYRIGFKYYSKTFSLDFVEYIIFDIIIVFVISINRNLLLTEGLWFKREEEIENIYQASERISIYKMKKYPNKIEAMKDLLLKYIYTPKEIINIKKLLGHKKSKIEDVKHKFPFFDETKISPQYDEAKKSYFNKMFTKTRNEKPGNDFYAGYTLVMFLICIYILFFFTKMDQDRTFGTVSLETTQFSGSMVLYLLFHVLVITYDRIIFVMQNRENIKYEYYFYKKNEKNGQGELLSENELNLLKSEISKNNINMRFDNISFKEIEILKKDYNILFIQKEQFNKPLLNKYILHIVTSVLSHIMIFFYFPIKGNTNLGCTEEDNSCNNFTKNNYIIFFYIFYLIYLILSSLQVKYGFYDIKRKSLFKKKDDELFSNMLNAFQIIPFLYEIKNALDWTCTSTCLTLFQWNKFEAIYDTIFDTYCEKSDWDERPIGRRISLKQKLSIGATMSFGLILILVIPLILFSSLNPTNQLNNINSAKITLDLTFNYENGAIKNYNLFENSRADSISDMFKNDDTIWEKYSYSKSVQTKNFNHNQVQRVIFSETSDRNWDLAGPHIKNLIKLLNLTENNDLSSIEINIGYELTRALPIEAQTCSNTFKVTIFEKGEDLEKSKGAQLLNDLRSALENCSDINVTIEDAYSIPLRLTSASDVNVIEDETYFTKKDLQIGFEGCNIENNKNNYINSYYTLKAIEAGETKALELHTFSDMISETTSEYNVMTFYISFVLLVGTYIREFLANEPEKIMLGEMPHPKRIVELCEGIKISRYSYDFKNEEYLYTILIELMRSPDHLKLITDSSLDHFKQREAMTEKN